MDPHLPATVRSLASHSPSPSHSASASATSSLHKRKRASPSQSHAPPFSSSRDGALTSNDDLESISGRNNTSSSPYSSDEVVDEDEEDYDNAIRTFTSSRLDNTGNVRGRSNSKLKTESTVKVEAKESASVGAGGGVGGGQGSAAGLVVKEDNVKSIFTENIQTSGAYSAREENLKREVVLVSLSIADFQCILGTESSFWVSSPV